MTARREYKIYCDDPTCLDWASFRDKGFDMTVGRARKQARRHGWRTQRVEVLGGGYVTRDYCRRHRP